jgi:hypothetical protein
VFLRPCCASASRPYSAPRPPARGLTASAPPPAARPNDSAAQELRKSQACFAVPARRLRRVRRHLKDGDSGQGAINPGHLPHREPASESGDLNHAPCAVPVAEGGPEPLDPQRLGDRDRQAPSRVRCHDESERSRTEHAPDMPKRLGGVGEELPRVDEEDGVEGALGHGRGGVQAPKAHTLGARFDTALADHRGAIIHGDNLEAARGQGKRVAPGPTAHVEHASTARQLAPPNGVLAKDRVDPEVGRSSSRRRGGGSIRSRAPGTVELLARARSVGCGRREPRSPFRGSLV